MNLVKRLGMEVNIVFTIDFIVFGIRNENKQEECAVFFAVGTMIRGCCHRA